VPVVQCRRQLGHATPRIPAPAGRGADVAGVVRAAHHQGVVAHWTVGVRVAGPLGLCDLLAWGRTTDGWWALIGWHDGGVRHPAGYPAAVYCTGWVRSELVSKWCEQTSTQPIPRVQLDGATWPPAEGLGSAHHFGLLDAEASPPLPPGYERILFASAAAT